MTKKNKINILYDFPGKVSVLGVEYKIIFRTDKDDEKLDGADGYCEFLSKEIVIDKSIFHRRGWKSFSIKKIGFTRLESYSARTNTRFYI